MESDRYRIEIDVDPRTVDVHELGDRVTDVVFDMTQDAEASGGPVSDIPVGRLVGREERADGTVFVSFRLVHGTIPSGPDEMGNHYELRWRPDA